MSKPSSTAAFIDLATFDELEKYMYGGNKAITYFIRATKKSTWFSTIPVRLNTHGGRNFGDRLYADITRSGDYLLQTWIEVDIPQITFSQSSSGTGLRWTKNLMHNLISEIRLEVSDLEVCKLDSYFLDFWSAFTTPAGKRDGYNKMIGNVPELTNPIAPGSSFPKTTLALPVPLCFTRDSGVAYPAAALPYVDSKICIVFRNWTELLTVDNINTPAGQNPSRPARESDLVSIPKISDVRVWGKYAIVSNDERKRMGCSARDILIEQVQWMGSRTISTDKYLYPIRFSHAIKTLFFGLKNTTTSSQHSIYTNTSPLPGQVLGLYPTIEYNSPAPSSIEPIEKTTLFYENTERLHMNSIYYNYIEPWYQPNAVIPDELGYSMYSYSLDFLSTDPKGSTNYGKLTNVELNIELNSSTIDASVGSLSLPSIVFPPAWSGQNWWPQTYSLIIMGISNNVVRVSGGAIGFPTL